MMASLIDGGRAVMSVVDEVVSPHQSEQRPVCRPQQHHPKPKRIFIFMSMVICVLFVLYLVELLINFMVKISENDQVIRQIPKLLYALSSKKTNETLSGPPDDLD